MCRLARIIDAFLVDEIIIPIGSLREIWNDDELRNFVKSVNLTDQQIQFARDNLLRTISLLAYIRDSNCSDSILQWIEDEKNLDEILHTLKYDKLFPTQFPEDSPAWQEEFRKMVQFRDARKYFTAVVLTEGEDIALQRGQGMPLVTETILGHGMNGKVMGYGIPPGHLVRGNTANSLDVLVARKTFHRSNPENANEILILSDLRRLLLNTNIPISTCISFITEEPQVHSLSYQSNSNLKTFLDMLNEYGQIDEQRLSDSIRQIRGITEALNFLHTSSPSESDEEQNTVFCHMDVKPENFLVFNSSTSTVGDWKIIDFGISSISKMRAHRTGGGPREEGRRHITVTVGTGSRHVWGEYQSPEVNDHAANGTEGRVGRGSDVWSLGCVFSEVLAANLGKLSVLKEDIRSYSELFYEESKEHSCSCDNNRHHLLSCPCQRHKRNRGFQSWLERELSYRPDLTVYKEVILDMTKIRRIQRLKAGQVVQRIDMRG